MEKSKYKITSKVFTQVSEAKLFFATIEKEVTDEIRKSLTNEGKSSEIINVIATINTTTWVTTLTPDTTSDVFLLPLKLGIRNKEGLKDGDVISFTLQIKELIPPQVVPVEEEDED